jgi:hypothetical protein
LSYRNFSRLRELLAEKDELIAHQQAQVVKIAELEARVEDLVVQAG